MNQLSRLAAVFFTMAAVLLLSIAASCWISYKTLQLTKAVEQHRMAIGQLGNMLSTIKDAETGQRGYLLTGDEKYLEPYHSALDHIQNNLNVLRDNLPSSSSELNRLDTLIQQKLAEIKQTIDLRRKGDAQSAQQIVQLDVGKQLMDSIHSLINQLTDQETDLLQKTRSSADLSTTVDVSVFIAALAVNLLFLGWAHGRIRRGDRASHRRRSGSPPSKGPPRRHTRKHRRRRDGRRHSGPNYLHERGGPAPHRMDPRRRHGQRLHRRFQDHQRRRPLRRPEPREKVHEDGSIVGLANPTLLIRRDGSEVPISDSGAPIRNPDGTVRGVVLVFHDCTEQRANERILLHAKQELEAAGHAKDQFLATLSHELRTPLTPVLASLSSWEASDQLPPSLASDVQMLRRNVELEARLIDDLLDLTRIVKGKFSLNAETVDVHELLRSVTTMYHSEVQGRKLRLSMRLDAPSYYVSADSARLQQVFWNIL